MIKQDEEDKNEKDKYIKDKILEIAESNNRISMAIFQELLNYLENILNMDMKDVKIMTIKGTYY
jgi:hypothetical protein